MTLQDNSKEDFQDLLREIETLLGKVCEEEKSTSKGTRANNL